MLSSITILSFSERSASISKVSELSTDTAGEINLLVTRRTDRTSRPKPILRVCWERLAEPVVRGIFIFRFQKKFEQT